jgi:hypothetical protein
MIKTRPIYAAVMHTRRKSLAPRYASGHIKRPPKPAVQPLHAEIIGHDTACACGLTAKGAAPVPMLCRALITAGNSPDRPMEAYRDGILALRVRSLAVGAGLTVEDSSDGRPRFRKYRPPFLGGEAARSPNQKIQEELAESER